MTENHMPSVEELGIELDPLILNRHERNAVELITMAFGHENLKNRKMLEEAVRQITLGVFRGMSDAGRGRVPVSGCECKDP